MPPPSTRLPLIDALRGIAALSVVLYHIYILDLLPHARSPFAEPAHTALVNGYLGVYIFFVVSGFVIAHSIRDARITPGFIGRFALRRSLRLDPPYWAAIVLAILAATVGIHDGARPSVSFGVVTAHMLYVQQFLGIPHLIGVFWTLCLEIQFYLAYVLLMCVVQQRSNDRPWPVFGPVWLVSLAVATRLLHVRYAVFLWAWPYFFLGVITAWHHERRISSRAWALVTGATSLILLGSHSRWISADDAPARTSIIAATTLALFLAGLVRRGDRSLLQTLTLGRPLQYLGRISYSLYLTHVLVCASAARLGLPLLGHPALGLLDLITLLLACAVLSVGVAHLMHIAVERPAQRLSRRVRLRDPDRG